MTKDRLPITLLRFQMIITEGILYLLPHKARPRRLVSLILYNLIALCWRVLFFLAHFRRFIHRSDLSAPTRDAQVEILVIIPQRTLGNFPRSRMPGKFLDYNMYRRIYFLNGEARRPWES